MIIEFIGYVLIFLIMFIIPALPVLWLLRLFLRYLERMSLSVRAKKIIFASVAIFCLIPTILPAATIFGFIVPNIIMLIVMLGLSDLSDLSDLNELIAWNIKTFPTLAPFMFITICVIIRVTLGLFKEEDTEKDIGIDTDIGTITDMNEDELY